MTDAEYEAQRKRVKALFEQWIKNLGLRWWRVVIEYDRDSVLKRDKERREGDWSTSFLCCCDWRYTRATITAYLSTIQNIEDDEELEQEIVHELCHVLINETRQNDADWLDHEERVATTLAKAFMWVRNAAREETIDAN